jgi:uncharacterized phage protein (TIGR02220 family)
MDNKELGYIKFYRSIKNHWIWDNDKFYKWWSDILFETNHSDQKVNIGFELFECKRGQSVKSLQTWAKDWKTEKDTVRNFFQLLKKDGMILIENLKKTTRITICNYELYQGGLHDEQTPSKRQANAKQTPSHPNKNDKNVKNDKNEIKKEYLSLFTEITGKNIRSISDKVAGQINARLNEGYTMDDLIQVIKNIKNDPYHIENPQHLTPEFATRNDKFVKYLNAKPIKKKQPTSAELYGERTDQ